MKPAQKKLARAIISLAIALALQPFTVLAAGPFTVNSSIADTHVSNTTTGTDVNGNVTLRSAIEAANAGGGAVINVPAGTYKLTLGELDVAPSGGQTTVIQTTGGANSGNTFIIQTDNTNRVFNVDSGSAGNTRVTLSGFTIEGGHDKADNLGGAGILAGSVTNVNKDALILSGCVITSNQCVEVSPGFTANPGGGVQMAGGDLLITSCTFSNNSSGAAFGGAIFFFNQTVASSLNITNSFFINNVMTNDSGSGPDGGGAIMIGSTASSTHTFTGDTFTGNHATGSLGNTYGGAIQMNGGTLNITLSTFLSNSVTGVAAQGGALYADSGNFNLSFCRFVGNAATSGNVIFNHTANGAVTVADNNWWNSNTGPGANDLVGATTTTYLKLTHYASPSLIQANSSTLLTASFITNSTGTAISSANLTTLIGLPIIFNGAVKGTITAPQATIQANGTAVATFNSGTVPGPASANAIVDNVTATALINIQCPTINAVVSGGGVICAGGASTVTVTLSGGVGPYIVTLNNGGGTLTNASPINFVVSPAGNTTYSISSATDADGCSATASGSATVTINPAPVATITPNPSSVCANSSGNNASGPAGMSGYAWTIGNGTITGPSNVQTISYAAGSSGIVTLGLTVTNSSGCTASSSVGVTINPLPVATITANPPVVTANSPHNQASGPAGLSGYSWTIINGFITGAANVQNITYVAGNEGVVELSLTVTNASGCTGSSSLNVPITLASGPPPGWSFRTNYFASITFSNGLTATAMPVAYDGTNYWTCSGGSATGVRYAQYDTNGTLLATYSPGLDFRSVFTDASGIVLARQFSDPTIYQQTSPGVFVPSGVVLNGGSLNAQSSVVLNGTGTEYIATTDGVVTHWDPDGNLLGTVNLQGFGSLSGEIAGSTQAHSIAAFGNFWLTYNGAGIVSVWDTFGNRLANCTLSGAGTSGESDWAFSYCNGKVFVVDSSTGLWRGYDVGSSGKVAIYGAPSTPSWIGDVQSKVMGTGSFVQVDTNIVSGGNPVPAVSNLVNYEGVLAFTDTSYSNGTNMGNALASYIAGGGGVVLATFNYSTGAFGIQGTLLTNGYLPFTLGGVSSPGNQTLVEDVPSHVIFSGVSSFNGGTSSYQNSVSIANSATQLGHWSGGTPLLAVKELAPGRIVGLNFYPPSSDARADFWVSSTSGGTLMANSLLWAGKVPPIIVTGPANLVESPGGSATFSITAAGLPPLTYQWRKNGVIIPGATTNSLSFTAQTASNGMYEVVVSNAYGIAVSEISTLNSPVYFLPFSISQGGSFPLLLGAADGSPLTAYRASRLSVYSTTNLTQPFATWTKLANPLVLTNGVVWVQGLSVSNSQMFFRVSESP